MRYEARHMQIVQPTIGRWIVFDTVVGTIICYFSGAPEEAEANAKRLAEIMEKNEQEEKQNGRP